jgi:hypothetical protein
MQKVDEPPDADHHQREVHLIKGMGIHLLAPHCEVAGTALHAAARNGTAASKGQFVRIAGRWINNQW